MSERVSEPQATLLVVEDEPGFRASLCRTLEGAGYRTVEAGDGKEALDTLRRTHVDLVLLDLRLPRISGMEVLRRLRVHHPDTGVVVLSAYGTVPDAVEATRLGALEFVEKEHDERDTLRIVREALGRTVVPIRTPRTNEECYERYAMIGTSPGARSVYDRIDRFSPTEAPVLIEGESGTGTNHVARAIHRAGARSRGRLVDFRGARWSPASA